MRIIGIVLNILAIVITGFNGVFIEWSLDKQAREIGEGDFSVGTRRKVATFFFRIFGKQKELRDKNILFTSSILLVAAALCNLAVLLS